MPTVDAAIEPALTALVNGLRELGVTFCIVGALVAELQLETQLAERTKMPMSLFLSKILRPMTQSSRACSSKVSLARTARNV